MNQSISILPIYLCKPQPSWPKPDLDLNEETSRLNGILQDLTKKSIPFCEFKQGLLYRNPNDVNIQLPKELENSKPDGIIMFNLSSGCLSLIQKVVDCGTKVGLPMILFSQPYSGHDWQFYSRSKKHNYRLDILATSDYTEIANRMHLIRTIKQLKTEKLIAIRPNFDANGQLLKKIAKKKFGIEIEFLSYSIIKDYYDTQAIEPSTALAEKWMKNAQEIVEPSKDEIVKSARLYLAIKKILDDKQATAITIDCLGGFARNDLPAYPCLTFAQLNDEGLLGVCECDVKTSIMQIIVKTLTGRTGFVSDPLFDTSQDAIIHAHCVSGIKLWGPEGKAYPYKLRSHLEDNKGVSLQVFMDIDQIVTSVNFSDVRQDILLLSTGKIYDNPDSDRGCRTKISTKVSNVRHILENWKGGLHRVVLYGDISEDLRNLGKFLDFKVSREDKIDNY